MNISRYVKIAAFFIVLGTAGGIYIITSADGLSDFRMRTYEVLIPDASGLSSRSKIYLAGVAVGRVRSITLGQDAVVMKVSLLKDIQVHEGASLRRKASSILGTSVLTLEQGPAAGAVIPPGGRIGTEKEAGDMGALMDTVQDLGGQMTTLLRSFQDNQLTILSLTLETFNSIAQKVDAQSDAELERVSRILESVALITGRTEQILAQAETNGTGPAADMYLTLENLRMITDEIRQGHGTIGQAIYDDRLYDSILATARQIETAVAKLQMTLDTVNSAAEGAETVIASAGKIVDRAAGLGIQVDTSASYRMMSSQMQAGASVRLHPASNDRWYRVGVSAIPGGILSNSVTETTDPGGNLLEQTETRNTFAIDAELARRFGILTFRGGLFENTAGAGIDIQPVRWVNFSGDVFNIQSRQAPNLRGTITIYPFFDPESSKPWNWIYLKGGINNSLTSSRDYFIGGGVRFADREIKGLVGLLPVLNN
ncbi:MAG: MlaD family protein [Treponema sp.]|jgi:phospholipid/cholesterol/gamma-HCH transport system substrate-binding protein|nr:MlaD family protein [Treponema sp.]